MTETFNVFLSYSHSDSEVAALLRLQLERAGLSVFKDDKNIRDGDMWLDRMQKAVDGCSTFVVLVGREGVRRWVGAETQVALGRYFGPHDDNERLPIFPILLDGTKVETLPAFLRLFQATPWTAAEPLPDRLLEQIRARTIAADTTGAFEGCPFVGLAAYRIDQAHLFFGRQKETLDALACFFDIRPGNPAVRWLEISGNSGAGKSSLMCAGLLPLVDQEWLSPRTGYSNWRRIGPMVPGEWPVAMLAESLARSFNIQMADIQPYLEVEDSGLSKWLRSQKQEDTGFLLAIDQFEELFTAALPDERDRFDRLLACAIEDPSCPLFVISTVRSDFVDRFEELPRLMAVRNRLARPWTLGPIGADGLREVIAGPARLANLDIEQVQEAMITEAQGEPGALPLVENALQWLWQHRESNRLSGRLLTEQGGLAGILSRCADDLLDGLGKSSREKALELLFRLVQVDPEGRRHTRRRIPLDEAIAVGGGGEGGRSLLDQLAGQRLRGGHRSAGPLRLVTVTEEPKERTTASNQSRWVNLIHETLIRTKGPQAGGKLQPFWPTLWTYIEANKERSARRERLRLLAREWKDREGLSRLFGLAGWSSLFGFSGPMASGGLEQQYLRWSRARAAGEILVLATVLGIVGENLLWAATRGLPFEAVEERWAYRLGKELPLPDLVPVSPGSFMMGSEREAAEQPVHPVTIAQPFQMGRTEVTFREWDACVADGECNGYRPADQGWGRDQRPVINVSWDDAQAYVSWLSMKSGNACRLPTEAEWEYAARAGTTTEFALPAPQGSDDIAGKELANCAECGNGWGDIRTMPVGAFPPNSLLLHDMHGNVFEWVEDCYYESYQGASYTGQARSGSSDGTCTYRTARGGSWYYRQDFARSAYRGWSYPDYRSFNLGFRVACAAPRLED